ncbi:MAG: WYL domain-containing protein [Betaproteobacteria bacterium HGW-Betaproteobacteria-4]|jgi:hypothetical protein|nr:MAG: WYL domain-containing protein [Betaproteobacteria bacterium HGW-Betaproteobacteria-4]
MYSSSFHTPSIRAGSGPIKWVQERRLEFIDFRLRWDGRLNRSDLIDFFGVSTPQASLDIARYSELAPNNLVYDRSARVYLAGLNFKPLFVTGNSSRYLNDLLATACGLVEHQANFIGWHPSVATVPTPGRAMSAATLAALLKAMREGHALRLVYQSMTSPEPSERLLSPHALAHDGFRWHVRAFCHLRHQFRDFVIARILSITGTELANVTAEHDEEWLTQVKLVLVPHPGLSEGHRRVIELDYGMDNGEVVLECRQALLFYLLKHLGLEGGGVARPEAQQIVLKNAEEVARFRTG